MKFIEYVALVLCYFLVIGVPAVICGIFWWYEAGSRAYSKGRAYYSGDGFHLKEESEGTAGKRAIAFIPKKTKYGWVWLDYYWKYEKEQK